MEVQESKCCTIESIITIDERGQMVLPKEVRQAAGFESGHRIAVVNLYRDGEVCCVGLMKANELSGAVESMLGPAVPP